LGARCRVGAHSSVAKSVLWDGAVVGSSVVLDEVILGRNAQVQAYSKVGKGSVLGDYSRV
jgi:NDP-sugar pyrophosphorylase family protein